MKHLTESTSRAAQRSMIPCVRGVYGENANEVTNLLIHTTHAHPKMIVHRWPATMRCATSSGARGAPERRIATLTQVQFDSPPGFDFSTEAFAAYGQQLITG